MEYYSGTPPPLASLTSPWSRVESEAKARHGIISDSFNNNNIIMQQQDYIMFVHTRLSGNILIELLFTSFWSPSTYKI